MALLWVSLAALVVVSLAGTVTVERLVVSVVSVEGVLLLALVLKALRVANRAGPGPA